MFKDEFNRYVKQIPTVIAERDDDLGDYAMTYIDAAKFAEARPQMQFGIPYFAKEPPARSTSGAAGLDVKATEDVKIPARGRAAVSTGLRLALPLGTFALVAGRSGIAFKHGVVPFQGIIDSDYRGELKILLFNHSDEDYEVKAGDRIAQLVLLGVVSLPLLLSEQLAGTDRGENGFGSTGD